MRDDCDVDDDSCDVDDDSCDVDDDSCDANCSFADYFQSENDNERVFNGYNATTRVFRIC